MYIKYYIQQAIRDRQRRPLRRNQGPRTPVLPVRGCPDRPIDGDHCGRDHHWAAGSGRVVTRPPRRLYRCDRSYRTARRSHRERRSLRTNRRCPGHRLERVLRESIRRQTIVLRQKFDDREIYGLRASLVISKTRHTRQLPLTGADDQVRPLDSRLTARSSAGVVPNVRRQVSDTITGKQIRR